MAISQEELDGMRTAYQKAVEDWIVAIREEEALASVNHNEAEIDKWEGACFHEEELRNRAKRAKNAYEAALRREFFSF
ncbi:MAG TPA: hypothetical protein VKV02_03980 [Acidobacteriaceae bacterium]|nr:hypothetical protein [Acidobacteriaceae bacterium]